MRCAKRPFAGGMNNRAATAVVPLNSPDPLMALEATEHLTVRAVRTEEADDLFRLIDKDRELFSTYFPVTTGRTTDAHATLA